MKFIHLGRESLDRDKFVPVINRELFIKPYGGLWASPYYEDSKYVSEWEHFCTIDFTSKNIDGGVIFELLPTTRIYTIDSYEDLKAMVEKYPKISELEVGFLKNTIDFEKASKDYDVIYLTTKGEQETRHTMDYSLYGWDVESILIMNFDVIKVIGTYPTKEEANNEKGCISSILSIRDKR